jgi:hypothetical protein
MSSNLTAGCLFSVFGRRLRDPASDVIDGTAEALFVVGAWLEMLLFPVISRVIEGINCSSHSSIILLFGV